MRRRFFIMILILALLVGPVHGAEDYIKWVDFNVSYEAMDKALALDIRSQEQDMPVSWIDLLALAACRTGGKVTGKPVEQAYQDLQTGQSPQSCSNIIPITTRPMMRPWGGLWEIMPFWWRTTGGRRFGKPPTGSRPFRPLPPATATAIVTTSA